MDAELQCALALAGAHDASSVTLTAADMHDPELLAELSSIMGATPPRAAVHSADLAKQVAEKKAEAVRLKRSGDRVGGQWFFEVCFMAI